VDFVRFRPNFCFKKPERKEKGGRRREGRRREGRRREGRRREGRRSENEERKYLNQIR
jgi:hypothetical protein